MNGYSDCLLARGLQCTEFAFALVAEANQTRTADLKFIGAHGNALHLHLGDGPRSRLRRAHHLALGVVFELVILIEAANEYCFAFQLALELSFWILSPTG